MNVAIYFEGSQIGSANLNQLDPPMGVASGAFVPAPDYVAERHANVIDGEAVADLGGVLEIRSEEFGILPKLDAAIQDFSAAIDEIVIDVIGIPYPLYHEMFSEYEGFKAYYPSYPD
jgi:hypothetical protein